MIGYYMTKSQVKSILSTFEVHFWAYVTFLGRFQTLCSATAPYFFDRAQNIVCCGMEFFHYDNPDVKILSREVWERDSEEHQNPQESMILLLL